MELPNRFLFFPELDHKFFLHPTDALALAAVKKLKGLDVLINTMNKMSYEKIFRIQSMGDDVRVTANTCTDIYHKVRFCAKVLSMPVPDVFINQSPFLNAFTTGTDSPMIQLYSGIIDYMDDQELLAVIAHEMGHIKCGHVLYHTAASALQMGSGFLGPLKILADTTFSLTLLEWERKSELSADRAALIVMQDIKPVIKVLMKLAGGSQKVADQIDYDDFIKQSKEYQKMAGDLTGRAYKAYLNLLRTHPFPVMRAAEIFDWSTSDEYKTILKNGKILEQNTINYGIETIELNTQSHCPKQIPLQWNVPNFLSIIGYRIYRRKEGEKNFQLIKETKGRLNNNCLDKNLQDGCEYFYYISTVDQYGNEGEYSQTVSAITKKNPLRIRELRATDGYIRRTQISWKQEAFPSDSKILLFRSCGNTKQFKKIDTIHSSQYNYLDNDLKDGEEYSYYLVIDDDGIFSEPSETITIKTKDLLSTPLNFKCSYNPMTSSIYFSWDRVDQAASYNIYRQQLIRDKLIVNTPETTFRLQDTFKKHSKNLFYISALDQSSRESLKSMVFTVEI